MDFFKPLSMNLSFYQAWNLDLLALGLLMEIFYSSETLLSIATIVFRTNFY